MLTLTSLQEVLPRYKALIVDLWGVIHDGERLYPGVKEALMELRAQEKQLIFLSNAPRRAVKSAGTLASLGIPESLYDHVITSGESLYGYLSGTRHLGTRYYYIGPDKDLDILEGLEHYQRSGLAPADFILNVGFFFDFQPLEDLIGSLKTAVSLGKPMLCANPDKVVVKQTGQHIGCAGMIAEAYEQLGGKVVYFGKPYERVYQVCLERFVDVKLPEILAIGDSLDTDIKGARQQGIDTLLITGGILKDALHLKGTDSLNKDALNRVVQESGIVPTYIISSLAADRLASASSIR
ncbi:MAG: TIGR01459 family HAD-type hydrolase [Rickettsiales bacterium]